MAAELRQEPIDVLIQASGFWNNYGRGGDMRSVELWRGRETGHNGG